jgi:HEAT repeat protein
MNVAAAVLALGTVLAQGPPPGFEGAKWIWYSREPMPISKSFPGGAILFRAAFDLPGPARSAVAVLTADNLYSLHVNGRFAGESEPDPDLWSRPKCFDVAALLAPGRNVVAVEAVNTAPGPAGLLVKIVANLADGTSATLVSDTAWKCSDNEVAGWRKPEFDDRKWPPAHDVGDYGTGPWGRVTASGPAVRADGAGKAARPRWEALKRAAKGGGRAGPRPALELEPPADSPWPEAVVFLGDDCSLYRPPAHSGTSYDSLTVTIFNPHHSRAFPEHDLPAPIKVGKKLFALRPARPGAKPKLLLDAGRGGIGSPAVSFDGRTIYVSMARDGEPFFHLYALPAEGGEPKRLTDGPFHDIDPAELPDGRIVFTSTRIGTFEEYHNPPSRALFVMNADGTDIHPITHTFIFDNEPEVMADGRILFIRSDNFFDRGKVETLLHAVYPDGTEGYTEFGLDLGPEYGGRLRAFNCGSPAPMPDGRVAFVTGSTIALGQPGGGPREIRHLRIEAGDVAALPDGRLLCTVAGPEPKDPKRSHYQRIGIADPQGREDGVVVLHDSPDGAVHSPVFLGARPRPPVLPEKVDRRRAEDPRATGVLFCQDARITRNTTAGWPHVRAVRVLAGKGLTVRSSHSYIVHAGSEAIELGTVPLAPDGSFAVEVPADTAIAFQMVDAEGRSELNEMSWIYVRPGEKRGCVGCHAPRQAAPPRALDPVLALRTPPLRLLGQGRPHRFRGNNAAVTGLMELQFDRYREVAGIDRHSFSGMAGLLKQLGDPDEGMRISAVQRLAVFRDRSAAPALAALLGGGSREARVAAALAVAACGTRESVGPLVAAAADPDPIVARAAEVALENLTGRARFRGAPWEEVEADLVRRLGGADRDDIRRAAVALGHVGGDAARAALRAYVARERDVNPYPEWRKAHHGDGAMFNARSPANPRTLQAAVRSLGYLRDREAVPMLAETLGRYADPATGNLFLAEAAAEALGLIGTPEAEAALADAFPRLKDYIHHTRWYGDHDALMACHASPVHYFILEALDALGSTRGGGLVPAILRSVPTDPDRALLPENDDYETLAGRVLRRGGAEAAVAETCLAILGDPGAKRSPEVEKALSAVHGAWGGRPDPENRAAQVLSFLCRDRAWEPRLRAAFERYRAKPVDIPRVFDTGIPVVTKLPVRHWVCFFLARALGNLADPASAGALIAALEESPPEAAGGRPDPLGPGVLFLHNDLTPCWRAAAAWALGRVGDRRAAPVLIRLADDLDNAPDVRHAAAVALGRIADPASADAVRRLAADYPEVSTRKALRAAVEASVR